VFGQEPDTKQGAIFEQGQVRGQGTNKWQFSIVMESTAQGAWVPGYGGDEKGTFGFEQYGNLRLEAPLNRWGEVYVAGNVLAASGSSLERGATTSTGQGYGSIVELERLYYRLETESSDWETGLLRIPFGFGQAFRPTDFLNPPNPLNPDARPRGVLGTVYTLYPTDSIIFRVYASLGKDPKQTDVAGASAGISGELHVPSSSIQGMYVFQAPEAGEQRPNHRMGLSFKWDGDVALTLDALYTLWGDSLATNQWYDRSWHPALGLQAAAGLDASLGSFIFLLQYFYNGGGPLNPKDSLAKLYEPSMGDWKSLPPNQRIVRSDVPIGDWNRRNYLHSSLLYKVDDYTRFTLSSTMNLDDGSFVPAISFEHEPFQGFSLQGTLRVFLDSHVWGLGPAGELGPLHTGKRADCTVKGRIRL
ncbi:MAG: hypothetical protein N2442_10795, partial [Spirochaetes bacterium]|nr:hypothetical protein [Spirochaetota bacterium]